MKYFRESIIVTIIALIIAVVYGGVDALILATILGIMEVSLSFDNAIVNARILERMSHRWRNIFLTVGMLIAVLGMRFIFPLAVVSVSAQMSPMKALHLAMEKGNPETVGTQQVSATRQLGAGGSPWSWFVLGLPQWGVLLSFLFGVKLEVINKGRTK